MKETENSILSFLQPHCGGLPGIHPLTGDGSTRRYYRVSFTGGSFILCRDENLAGWTGGDYPFLAVHALFSEAGIPVPRIIDVSGEHGYILQEDMGDLLLEEYAVTLSHDDLLDVYMKVLGTLCDIQSIRGKADIPFGLSFDREKLMFEFDFFIRNMIGGYLKHDPVPAVLDDLRGELDRITDILVKPGLFVLNHRDFHSRNIMILRGSHRIIDFQDARMGLPHYDMVSVLRDSYLQLDPSMYKALTDYYYAAARDRGITSLPRDVFDYYTDIMAFQRNVKALGSFGWLCSMGKTWFGKYIPPTFSYLADYAGRRAQLRRAYEIIQGFFE